MKNLADFRFSPSDFKQYNQHLQTNHSFNVEAVTRMLCLACVPLPGYGAELDQSSGLQYVQPHLMKQEIED